MALKYFPIFLPVSAVFVGFSSGWWSAPSEEPPPAPAPFVEKIKTPEEESAQLNARLTMPFPATVEGLFEVMAETEGPHRIWLIDQILSKLDAKAAEAAALRAESLPRQDQATLLPLAIARWTTLDVAGVEKWIITKAATFRKGSATFVAALDAFAAKEPERALKLANEIAESDRKERLIESAMKTLGQAGLSAVGRLNEFPEGPLRNAALRGLLAGLAMTEPEAALARVGELAEKDRSSVITTLIQQFRAKNPAKAIALIEQLPAQDQGLQFSMLVSFSEEGSVLLFADAAERLSAALGEKINYWYIARGLVKRDPAKALEWAARIAKGGRELATTSVLREWAYLEPRKALDWALANPPPADAKTVTVEGSPQSGGHQIAWSGTRQTRIQTVFAAWAALDPTAANTWLGKGVEPQIAAALWPLLIPPLIERNDNTTATEVFARIPDEEQSKIATSAVRELAYNTPDKAAQWLARVQPDEGAAELFADVASRWALKDFKGVTTWLDKLPASPARTSAVLAFAETTAGVDPAAAADWALTAGAEEERRSVLARVLRHWHGSAPTAARTWVSKATQLTEAERQTLQQITQ